MNDDLLSWYEIFSKSLPRMVIILNREKFYCSRGYGDSFNITQEMLDDLKKYGFLDENHVVDKCKESATKNYISLSNGRAGANFLI